MHQHGMLERRRGQTAIFVSCVATVKTLRPLPRLARRRGSQCSLGATSKSQLDNQTGDDVEVSGPLAAGESAKLLTETPQLGSNTLWIVGLAAGVVAASAYPLLRGLSAGLQKDDAAVCLSVFGVCGGVLSPSLQDFFKSTVGLLFSFLLGYTFYVLLARRQAVYTALFEEVAIITQLLEESQLYLPSSVVLQLVKCLRQYSAPMWTNLGSEDPAMAAARDLRCDRDAIEEMTRLCIDGVKQGDNSYSEVLNIVRAVRLARFRRLAALQSPIPTAQYVILSVLALLSALPPFLEAAGDSTTLSQVLYGILVSVLVTILAAVQDVANPASGGAYGLDRETSIILSALDDALHAIEDKHGQEEPDCP